MHTLGSHVCARAHDAAVSRAEAARTALDDAAVNMAAQVKRRDKVAAALAAMPPTAQPGAAAQEAGSERSAKRRTRSAAASRPPVSDEASGRNAGSVERQGSPAAGRTASAMHAAAALPESPALDTVRTCAGGQAPAGSAPAAERPGRALRARRALCSSDDSSPERPPRHTPCASPPARSPQGPCALRARKRGSPRSRRGASTALCSSSESSPERSPRCTPRTGPPARPLQGPHTLSARTHGSVRSRRGAGAVGARRLVDDSAEDSDFGVAATQGPGAASAAARRQGPRRAGRVRRTPGAGGGACGGELEQELLALAAEEDHLVARTALLPVYLTCGLKQQGSWLAESTPYHVTHDLFHMHVRGTA